jgi:hypothetical protein
MNMLGFTAESSLSQSSWCYSMTGDVVSHGRSGKKIIPQAPIILDGFGNGRYCCFKINGRWWCGTSTQA